MENLERGIIFRGWKIKKEVLKIGIFLKEKEGFSYFLKRGIFWGGKKFIEKEKMTKKHIYLTILLISFKL